jgi:hypothetical protein
VLNCLFAALNNGVTGDEEREDDTPYMDIPAAASFANAAAASMRGVVRPSPLCDTPPSSQKSSSTTSSSNEMSCNSSDSSGGGCNRVNLIKSKSAHHLVNNCSDVYAEVVDTLRPSQRFATF